MKRQHFNFLWVFFLLISVVPKIVTATETSQESWKMTSDLFIYSESNYFPSQLAASNETTFRLTFLKYQDTLGAYGGTVIGRDSSGTQISPFLGLRAQPLRIPMVFFTELRQTLRADSNQSDFRAGTFGYEWWDLAKLGAHSTIFEETYGEAVFSSLQGNQLLLSAWAKTGLRLPVFPALSLDGFGELAGTLDFARTGLGLRANLHLGPVTTQVLGTRSFGIAGSFPGYLSPWNGQLLLTGEL